MAPNKPDLVSRDYTIHLAKRTHKTTFKSKTPKAIKVIKKFAQDAMKTKDVRLDPKVNKEVWKQSVRNPPKRIRVKDLHLWKTSKDADPENSTRSAGIESEGGAIPTGAQTWDCWIDDGFQPRTVTVTLLKVSQDCTAS